VPKEYPSPTRLGRGPSEPDAGSEKLGKRKPERSDPRRCAMDVAAATKGAQESLAK